MGDLGSIPGLGRSPGEGKGYPLQHSGLENSKDYVVHGVAELDTTERLSLSLRFRVYILKIILGAFYCVLGAILYFPSLVLIWSPKSKLEMIR